jgi:hypothetical protein
MSLCPFCKNEISENQICVFCGYSTVLALPFYPTFKTSFNYLLLAITSILLAIVSWILTFLPELSVFCIITLITSISLAGITLEKLPSKFNCFHIRWLAILGIGIAVAGYIFFMFFKSHVPGIGYSM